jgi:fluoride exporter
MTYILVAIGGAFGSTLRFWLGGIIDNWVGPTFPWGTLLINISGSLAIGLFATLTAPDGRLLIPGEWRQFVMIGICGGYTTFSSFSLQTLTLARNGEMISAALYIVLSVVLCLLGVWMGHAGAMLINK